MPKTQLRLYDWGQYYEKMLYDNAQLVRAYLHAWQITEGEEGKFYVWTLDEIRAVLQEDSEFFEAAYGVTERGNWEGKTVLQRALDDASLAARFGLDANTVPGKLADSHAKLFAVRSTRIRPGTDDKILTAWNGLMLATIAESARVLGDPELQHKYLTLATRNADFLLDALRPNNRLRRSWRQGKATKEVFLEDYAALILGLIELYQKDFQDKWFGAAQEIAEEMIDLFSDPNGGFFDTAKDSGELLLRLKDLQDNATPSGNVLACEALLKLAAFTDRGEYRDLAETALGHVAHHALRYPTSFARWLSAADFALGNVKQIAVVYQSNSDEAKELLETIQSTYRPNTVVAASAYPPSENGPALLKDRPLKEGAATAYVCEGFVCKMPVNTSVDLQGLL